MLKIWKFHVKNDAAAQCTRILHVERAAILDPPALFSLQQSSQFVSRHLINFHDNAEHNN